MAEKEGYLVVQYRHSGRWLCGVDRCGRPSDVEATWAHRRDLAKRFESQSAFRNWFKAWSGINYRRSMWSDGNLRFVRVRPRTEAA